jgi:two-component system, NarL family, nitrate/nitrite response regulator NarL
MAACDIGTRILIVDDNRLFREGLRTLLEEQPGFSVVGEAANTDEALLLINTAKPGILLLSAETPDPAIIRSALRSIFSADAKIRIVLLSGEIKPEQAAEAFRSGVHGLLTKESAAQLLFQCINAVMDQGYWIPDKSISNSIRVGKKDGLQKLSKSSDNRYSLTKREMEILALVIAGRTNREISRQFSISEHTVKHHVTNMFDKLGVYNRLELALFAIHHGLVPQKTKE